MTAQEIIKAAMRVIGVIASGETPTADELADGLESMQMMLREWAAEGLPVEILDQITHTLSAGTVSYTIGASGSGADITSDWPVEIVSGYTTSSEGLDYPLNIMDYEKYDDIPTKTRGGIPNKLFYNPTYPTGTIYLYQVPTGSMTMKLRAATLMDEPSLLTSDISFPPFYDSAIKWNLAIVIAPEYGKTPSEIVNGQAYHSKAIIEARNALSRATPVRLPLNRYYRNYSINEG